MTINNLLIIGSGKFIEQTVLPALTIVQESYRLVGIHNKSGEVSDSIKALISDSVQISGQLNKFSHSEIDSIIVCVPQRQVIDVLNKLIKHGLNNKRVFLSTPVIPFKHLHLATKLRKFPMLHVLEFVPFHPKYQIAHSLINNEDFGKLRLVSLNHSGYMYHGAAVIRRLTGYRTLTSIKTNNFGRYSEYHFHFKNNISAKITEPRDYENGRLFIAGTRQTISDYPLNSSHNIEIKRITSANGDLSHYQVNGNIAEHSATFSKATKAVPQMSSCNGNPVRQEFIIAAAEFFQAHTHNITPYSHTCADTIYEHLTMRIAKKLSIYVNILSILNISPLLAILKRVCSAHKRK